MPEFPGHLTPSERNRWIERFRELAEEQYGPRHVTAIEAALESAALATGAVLKLEFLHDESPGFYLPVQYEEYSGQWNAR